jgi:hypothetical protein
MWADPDRRPGKPNSRSGRDTGHRPYARIRPNPGGRAGNHPGNCARWPRSIGFHGIEAIGSTGQQRGLGPPPVAGFRPVWLAVDEHVVGLVWDIDDRGGLRVAGSGWGDAADRVEAEHLNNVRQAVAGCRVPAGCRVSAVRQQLAGDVERMTRVRSRLPRSWRFPLDPPRRCCVAAVMAGDPSALAVRRMHG